MQHRPQLITGCCILNGHPSLALMHRVSHTSFIHGDSRHFASSRAISESIKKAINFERTKKKKRKKKEWCCSSASQASRRRQSLKYWQRLSARYPKGPEPSTTKHISSHRLLLKSLLDMFCHGVCAYEMVVDVILDLWSTKRIIYIFIYFFLFFLFFRRDD